MRDHSREGQESTPGRSCPQALCPSSGWVVYPRARVDGKRRGEIRRFCRNARRRTEAPAGERRGPRFAHPGRSPSCQARLCPAKRPRCLPVGVPVAGVSPGLAPRASLSEECAAGALASRRVSPPVESRDGRTAQKQADPSPAAGPPRRRRHPLPRRRARRPEPPLGAAADRRRQAPGPRARRRSVRRARRGARRRVLQPSDGASRRGPDGVPSAVEGSDSAQRASGSTRRRPGRDMDRRTDGVLWSGIAARSWTGAWTAGTRSAAPT